MSYARRSGFLLAAVAALFVTSGAVLAQANMAPTNDLPNPYRTVEGWAKLPAGRTWGSTSAVEIDRDGVSVWVAERCSANNCAGSDLDPILKFSPSGELVTSFGAGMLISPHGIFVDHEGNVWVTDCACTGGGARGAGGGAVGERGAGAAPATPRGHQVYKFSPAGRLLLTLGKAGGGKGTEFFYQPNDVLVAPNGDIFVADGHSSADTANARILKFRSDGTLVKTWGSKGSGREQLDQPHALAMDSRGRLFVGDRTNNRIQIYDQEGTLLDTWYQFSRPSGIYIRDDIIYVADSESGSVSRDASRQLTRSDWKRGIRIGSARDGTVTALIPDPAESPPSTSAAEGVAVDRNGVVYGAEVGPRALKRYERRN